MKISVFYAAVSKNKQLFAMKRDACYNFDFFFVSNCHLYQEFFDNFSSLNVNFQSDSIVR